MLVKLIIIMNNLNRLVRIMKRRLRIFVGMFFLRESLKNWRLSMLSLFRFMSRL